MIPQLLGRYVRYVTSNHVSAGYVTPGYVTSNYVVRGNVSGLGEPVVERAGLEARPTAGIRQVCVGGPSCQARPSLPSHPLPA